MLSMGRASLKGHRMEMYVIQLWILLCWLIPIAAELLVRRFLPTALWSQAATLAGSFLLNRLLLAPAHTGYYACCHRLAAHGCEDLAVTCEIELLQPRDSSAGLLHCFFADYRHPLKALRWQLKWDALRLVGYTLAGLPGLLLIVMGAGEQDTLLQALFGGSGALLGIAGLLLAWVLLRRLQPALYRRPQYDWGRTLVYAFRQTGRLTGEILLRYVQSLVLLPLLFCPFSVWRTALYTEIAALLLKHPVPARKKAHSQIFHTRVLRES